jgi:regulator of sigma E protease
MASIFWFIILIGILIFVHEGGHFLFAKLFNVRVLTFSLGFGGPVRIGRYRASWQPGETEYRIAWFPLGGFVRMLGDDPTQEIAATDQPRAFLTQPAWKRFLIIFGGPLFSILLAVPIYFGYHLMRAEAAAPVVGRVIPGSPADEAGIRYGDRVTAIGGEATETWEEIDEAIQDSGGEPVAVHVERDGQQREFEIEPWRELDETGLELLGERWDLGLRHHRLGNTIGVVAPDSPAARAGLQSWDRLLELGGQTIDGWVEARRLMRENGLQPLPVEVARAADVRIGAVTIRVPVLKRAVVEPVAAARAPPGTMAYGEAYTGIEPIALYVHGVLDDFPAKAAGIEPGDKIVAIGGRPIRSWEQFSRYVVAHADSSIPVAVRHQGRIEQLAIQPKIIETKNEFKQITRKPGLGVSYQPSLLAGETITRPDRLTYALEMSVVQTWRAITMNIRGFVRIFEGRVEATEAIGGPIMILDVAGKSAAKGIGTFLSIMAFLSVLLGLLNLLPIPILDGGHILFIVIEAIRRKPLSLNARVMASYVGLLLLIGLMAFAFYNDISRYWSDITSIFG